MGYSAKSESVKTFTPTVTGFSSTTVTEGYYTLSGKQCRCTLYISGTSNATTFTTTLPFTADATQGLLAITPGRALDNGAGIAPYIRCRAGSVNIADVYNGPTLTTWTGSGTKQLVVHITYYIE